MTVHLIGLAPSRRDLDALDERSQSGHRLAWLSGTEGRLRDVFHCVNLIETPITDVGHSPRRKLRDSTLASMRVKAERLLLLADEGDHLVLLGRDVQDAFHLGKVEYFEPNARHCRWLHACPHPSGLNHFWNDEAEVVRAQRFFRLMRWTVTGET